MDQSELRARMDQLMVMFGEELKKPQIREADKKFAQLCLIGLELLGDVLIDIKRIADKSEVHIHCPPGSILNAVGNVVRIEPATPIKAD